MPALSRELSEDSHAYSHKIRSHHAMTFHYLEPTDPRLFNIPMLVAYDRSYIIGMMSSVDLVPQGPFPPCEFWLSTFIILLRNSYLVYLHVLSLYQVLLLNKFKSQKAFILLPSLILFHSIIFNPMTLVMSHRICTGLSVLYCETISHNC